MPDWIPGGDRTGGTDQSPADRFRSAVGRGIAGTLVAAVAATGVASARSPAPLQSEGVPLAGPTVVLVVALVVGVGLRALERGIGPMSTWGAETTDASEPSTTTRQSDSTGSTAGRTIESSSATSDEPKTPVEAPATQSPADSGRRERTRHASGTFNTTSGGGTLMVTSPGFEPDLVFLTGASRGPSEKTGFSEGWSHGVAYRTGTGDVDQYAVSAADTGPGTAGGGIREDAALDLATSAEGSGTDAVWGKVATTLDEGFQFEVSTPSGHDRTTTVQYHALSLPEEATASVGTFGLGSEPRRGKVDLGVEADYVSLTATTGARPLTRNPERPVAISHGTVTGGTADPEQAAVGGTVAVEGGCFGARENRAVHLVHPDDGSVAGRTSMRVTSLGRTMRIELEEIHEPSPVAFAVYAAVSMPEDDPTPTGGMVTAPGPEKGARASVPTGFTPASVDLTGSAGAVGDSDRWIGGTPGLLGWSHGVIDGEPGGMAGSLPLRTLDADEAVVDASLGMGIDDEGFVLAAMEDTSETRPEVLYTAWPGEPQ
jgi:hypothetical protein